MNSTGSGSGSSGSRASGGGSKILLLIVALVVLLGGGKLTGLFGGDGDVSAPPVTVTSGSSVLNDSSSSGSGLTDILGGGGNLTNLLSSFLSSGGSSVYDFSGLMPSMTGSGTGSSQSQTVVPSTGSGSSQLDETVASSARDKFTKILGKQKDTVTILVYLCGSDLESQNGMGTADLKEMTKASLNDQVNLIVYTGGCKRWRNSVVSSSVNQIYQIRDGGLYCLEDDMGSAAMTNPDTLTKFIRYGAEHFPANRMELIFWDHGGGSVTGYGHDEKFRGTSMTLAGINTALKNSGVTFDFIGFDACLMATLENGIMLSQYADYLIASEETEPGVGWYYTNWLTQLSKNVSMPTTQIGRLIADDFVSVCSQQCRGQATTLSVVDLAELAATVPKELKDFSLETSELIQQKEYKKVSTARAKSREFAQSTKIDQIDLVHFARNLGTQEASQLADAIEGAVKYNRTGGGITNAYGLSIYFPYKRVGKVNQMVSTYQAIGMEEEYTRCIQEFASLEVSGQVASGTPVSSYSGTQQVALPGLMDSLLGGGVSSGYAGYGSSGDLTDLLGGLFGGSSSGSSAGSLLDLFAGRSLTAESAAAYIEENHFDPSALVWKDGRITVSRNQWSLVEGLTRNVFVDDGQGFIDLGEDNEFTLDGDDLIDDFDGTWLSIDGHPVAYYYMGTDETDEDHYVISGYVPALLNGIRVNLILNFDDEQPYGYIAGAHAVYSEGETDAQAKMMIGIGEGDTLQFLCDYYDYEGNYRDSYKLGDPLVLGAEPVIANTPVGEKSCRVTYCFTDLYQQHYWTPARESL